MKKVRAFFAILLGKAVKLFCKIVNKGGTAMPGRLALKLYPELLAYMAKDVSCIVVTGTNGKTSSCRMVEEGFRQAGLDYLANVSGANLIEGITTDFIANSDLGGKCRKKWAVLETDEAASREVCRQLQPKVVFVTNIFVDQVDRFGGVKNTRDWILSGAKNAPDAILCLNADDSVSASIAKLCDNRTVFYGFEESAMDGRAPGGSSDVEDCVFCGETLGMSYRSFSHLGGFSCPGCGYARPAADYSVSEICTENFKGTEFILNGEKVRVNLPALYNVYNACGAIAALESAGISHEDAVRAMDVFKGSFGRMEQLNLGKQGTTMILVKNGAGCDQVLTFLAKEEEPFVLSIYLNNNISDGQDISWLEGVDFESLKSTPVSKIYVSGMRTEEMYARLVKAGLEDRLIKEPNCGSLITELGKSELPVIILPTYTGMMETRTEIIRRCGGEQFWEL